MDRAGDSLLDLVAGSGLVFGDRDMYVLKGVPDEWRLYSVEWSEPEQDTLVEVAMEQSQYSTAAHAAINFVKNTVRYRGLNTAGGWIRNPAEIPQKFAARIDSLRKGEQRSAKYQGAFSGENYVNEMAQLAKETQTGNCSELSAVAFNFLKAQGIRPLDYFGVFRGGWNHAFVILNRDAATPLSNFKDWSYAAVLCDPLYDRAADAGYLATWYARMFPLKDSDVKYRIE